MAAERLAMRKIREILRQKWELGRSHREIARSLGVSVGAVAGVVTRATRAGWDGAAVTALSDAALEAGTYTPPAVSAHPAPDCLALHTERQKRGVTLALLHLEYLEQHPDGYRYTQFCEQYRRWCATRRLSMRQVHRAGEKLFVDYSGVRPAVVAPHTGEVTPVELFVAVLGASNYTYAEATATQRSPDFLASHVRCFAFLGGVPAALVPDQLKSGVTRACRYEPGLQRAYEELSQHYGTAILPARPAHPRDKAKVEVAVQIVQRWILARLRHQSFFSLAELNARIADLVLDLNARPMRVYRASRRALFEQVDQPALRPLPAEPYEYAQWKTARVHLDYHVELEGHYYSVPHALVGQAVELRSTATTVEVLLRGQRVASHVRQHVRGRHTTEPAHMPKAHQKHLAWTPARLESWAAQIGPSTGQLVTAILTDRPHPEQGYRTCLGLLRLAKRDGDARLEAACTRALRAGARSYRHVDNILQHGLDRLPLDAAPGEPAPAAPTPVPAHVRGGDYYRTPTLFSGGSDGD